MTRSLVGLLREETDAIAGKMGEMASLIRGKYPDFDMTTVDEIKAAADECVASLGGDADLTKWRDVMEALADATSLVSVADGIINRMNSGLLDATCIGAARGHSAAGILEKWDGCASDADGWDDRNPEVNTRSMLVARIIHDHVPGTSLHDASVVFDAMAAKMQEIDGNGAATFMPADLYPATAAIGDENIRWAMVVMFIYAITGCWGNPELDGKDPDG